MGKTKTIILKTVVYTILFALLCLGEKVLNFHGLSIAFLLAHIFCRENIFIILPVYAVSSVLIAFSYQYLICVAIVCVLVSIIKFVHFKTKKAFLLLEINLLLVLCEVPQLIFFITDIKQLIYSVSGVIISQLFFLISLVYMFPVLVRGLKYRLSRREEIAFLIGIAVFSLGLGTLTPFDIKIYYGVAALFILISKGLLKEKSAFIAVAMGIGGCIFNVDLSILAISAILGLTCIVFYGANKYLSALLISLSFLISYHFLVEAITLKAILPVLIGSLLSLIIPQRFYKVVEKFKQSYQGKFALRAVVNRDREAVAVRINYVAKAFEDMRKILCTEQMTEICGADKVVSEVEMKICGNCRSRELCKIKSQDEFYGSLINLAKKSFERGKVTLLDTNLLLSDNCILLPNLVSAVNESVEKKKENQIKMKGVMEGRDMLISQMGGVSMLMQKMALDINKGFIYDTGLETKIIDCLGYNNIVATDIVVYGKDNKIEEVNLVVRESDCEKAIISEIVSRILKRKMQINSAVFEINNMVSLNLSPAPIYDICYGECGVAKDEKCGDIRQAVKIAKDKIMFVLSDGMGSGQNAYDTANNIILLIESFYKAGYEHSVVLSMVSKLLAFRIKEDFSALDIVIIDTQSGDMDIIKQGGRESYILNKGGCDTISGSSLPIGIVEECEPSVQTRKIEKGEVFIMISDGVADFINSDSVKELFMETGHDNPQFVANKIVENARRIGGSSFDDMTCMAIKIK